MGRSRWLYSAKPLPYELSREVAIKLEEGLFDQAIALLRELLYSGMSTQGPVFVPGPAYLSVLCTLAVHPNFTNRAKDLSMANVSIAALEYLHALINAVDPIEANLVEAFAWPKDFFASRRGTRRPRDDNDDDDQDANSFANGAGLRTAYGGEKAVFNNSASFWQVAGWAFRCSLVNRRRWQRAWLPWLQYMVDVLEQDWEVRNSTLESQQGSLMMKYFFQRDQILTILRAIFADASDRSASAFKEIWKNETKPPLSRRKEREVRKQNLDFNEGEYGDYLDPSSDEGDAANDDEIRAEAGEAADDEMEDKMGSGTARSAAAAAAAADDDDDDPLAIWGGFEVGILRIRLLSLVLQLVHSRPDKYGDFWHAVVQAVDYLRPLPLKAFSAALNPHVTDAHLPRHILVSLLKCLARTVIQSGSRPFRVNEDIDQATLVESFLPYAANTNLIADNARMSVCLELLMAAIPDLEWTPGLEAALSAGIDARQARATRVKGPKGEASGASGGDGRADRQALAASTARLRLRVELLKT